MRAKLFLTLLLLAVPLRTFSQTITASLEGMVTDPTGAVVTGAQVRIVNTETNVAADLVTDSAGRFLAPSLPAGLYDVTVEVAGFKKAERSGVRLQVNQAARLELVMELGTATETITLYTYALAFRLLQIGKASALGVLTLLVTAALIALMIRLIYRRERGAF